MAWGTPTVTEGGGTGFSANIGTSGTGRLVEIAVFSEVDVAALTGVTVDGKAATKTLRAPHDTDDTMLELWRIDEAALGASAGSVTIGIGGGTSNMAVVVSAYTSDNGFSSATAFARTNQINSSSVTVLDALSAADNLVTFSALAGSSTRSVDTWPAGMTENAASALVGILQYGNARGVVGAGFTAPAGDDYTAGLSGSSSAVLGVVVVYVEAAGGGGGGGGGGGAEAPVGSATGQYGVGTATFTQDSAVVTGTGTDWSSTLTAGDLISTYRGKVLYEIASVDSDTQVTLTSAWKLPTFTDWKYTVVRDFSVNYDIPLLSQLDFDTNGALMRALAIVDAKLKNLSDRAPGA